MDDRGLGGGLGRHWRGDVGLLLFLIYGFGGMGLMGSGGVSSPGAEAAVRKLHCASLHVAHGLRPMEKIR